MPAVANLLVFTDGLPDGIGGQMPEQRICEALRGNGKNTMQVLERLVDSKFNEDDITILLLRRVVGTTAAPIILASTDR